MTLPHQKATCPGELGERLQVINLVLLEYQKPPFGHHLVSHVSPCTMYWKLGLLFIPGWWLVLFTEEVWFDYTITALMELRIYSEDQ